MRCKGGVISSDGILTEAQLHYISVVGPAQDGCDKDHRNPFESLKTELDVGVLLLLELADVVGELCGWTIPFKGHGRAGRGTFAKIKTLTSEVM